MNDDSAYRLDGPTDFDASSASSEEIVQEMYNDDDENTDLIDFHQHQHHHQQQTNDDIKPPSQVQNNYRPPPIATSWDASIEVDDLPGNSSEDNMLMDQYEQGVAGASASATRVSFNVPRDNHYATSKRYDNEFSPYPSQSLRYPQMQHNTPNPTGASASLAEVTPAFLRRAAQDLGMAKHVNNEPPPPNSLLMVRDRVVNTVIQDHASLSNIDNAIPDTSFFGADASALDGTFVSIRDLNDDDDVPSIDNDRNAYGGAGYSQWSNVTNNGKGSDASFPTETTSLLGRKKLNWQGGFFGSQVEKEDRRERMKMMRAKEGWFTGWLWSARSLLSNGFGLKDGNDKGRSVWNHPAGEDFAPRASTAHVGGVARQRVFSLVVIGIMCFHMALCGLHDLFLKYVSFRNSDDAGVSWNGEGIYIPAFWLSFEGRVLNPFLGPGARTLTAFGALVPGIVLKGQGWRVGTALFQSSSLIQMLLHVWVLKTVIGGSTIGLEWKRGTFTVALFYILSALVGSAWSIALEPGRLITSSGLGLAGLLSAVLVEQACFPVASKDEDSDVGGSGSHHNDLGGGSNVVTSTANESFSYQPHQPPRRKRSLPLNTYNPLLLLSLEVILSWWGAYSSLVGTIASTVMGVACALLLFVGNPIENTDRYANHHLLFSEETPPPPPVSSDWRDDDDSADSSFGGHRQVFNTPLMRRSILADEDDDDEQPGSRSLLRKRKNDVGTTTKTTGLKGRVISVNSEYIKQSFSASRVLGRVVGIFLALLLTLIPASLIAGGDDTSNEVTRASVLGCKPMRVVYKQDNSNDVFECAGGCIPLSRTRVAKKSEGMRDGRCDSIGFRCSAGTGTLLLRKYKVDVGLYTIPSSNGSCASSDEEGNGDEAKNNDDAISVAAEDESAYNGEVEGVDGA